MNIDIDKLLQDADALMAHLKQIKESTLLAVCKIYVYGI